MQRLAVHKVEKQKGEKRIFRWFYFATFFLLSYTVHAETDSTYIRPFDEKLAVKLFTSKTFLLMEHDIKEKTDVSYMSNTPVGIGAGILWHNTGISFGYGFDFMRDKKKGKTQSIDFQYHYYGRKVVSDFYFLKYKGFYIEEDNFPRKNTEYVISPDLTINQYGVFGQYVFNGEKFSYKATFNQSERQLRPAGSFILGGGAYLTEIKSDTSFVINGRKDFRNFQIGVSAGYAYSWIIKENYFITGSVSAGVNFGKENGLDKWKAYPTALPRIAAGYNHKDWSIAMSFHGNMVSVSFSDKSYINVFSGNFQLSFTKRFGTYNKIFDKLPVR